MVEVEGKVDVAKENMKEVKKKVVTYSRGQVGCLEGQGIQWRVSWMQQRVRWMPWMER